MKTTLRRLALRPWVAVVAALAAAACDRPPAPAALAEEPAAPVSGGTAVIAVGTDITGIHPLLDDATHFNQEVIDLLFLHLFEEQPDFAYRPPTFAPGLAADWQWSADRLSLEISLRTDVVWSDGAPLTAADVVWTWQRQIDPAIAWGRASTKRAITAIEPLGDHRLRVRFARASPDQLAELNQGAIMPAHAWSRLPPAEWRDQGDWFRDHLVVSGPFTLADWQPDRQIVLARNPRYAAAGLPRLDRLVFRIIPDRGSLVPLLLAGEADFVRQLPPSAAAAVEADPQSELLRLPGRQYNFVWWNLRRPPFADAAIRRALTQAIDRQALVDTLWYGHAAVSCSPIPGSVWAHDPELRPWPFDPAAARRQLAELGWRDGDGDGVLERDAERFAFELLTNSDNQARVDAAVMIQENLRQVGIEARVRSLEFQEVVRRIKAGRFDAALSAWTIDTSLDLRYAFHSQEIGEGGMNYGAYANPRVDELIDAARDSLDPDERGELLRRIQRLLHQDQPYTFLWEPMQLDAHRRRLRAVRANSLSSLFQIEQWWLEPPA